MQLNRNEVTLAMQAVWEQALVMTRIQRDGELTPIGLAKLQALKDLLLRMEPDSDVKMSETDRAAVGL